MNFKLFLFFAVLLFASCGENTDKPAADTTDSSAIVNDGWKTYSGKGYSIQYPAGWELDLSGTAGCDLIIASPPDENTMQYGENFFLVIEPVGDTMDLDKYVARSTQEIVQDSGVVTASKRMSDQSGPCHMLSYTATIVTSNAQELNVQKRMRVLNGKAYTLAFVNTADYPELYLDIATRVFDSFKVDQLP